MDSPVNEFSVGIALLAALFAGSWMGWRRERKLRKLYSGHELHFKLPFLARFPSLGAGLGDGECGYGTQDSLMIRALVRSRYWSGFADGVAYYFFGSVLALLITSVGTQIGDESRAVADFGVIVFGILGGVASMVMADMLASTSLDARPSEEIVSVLNRLTSVSKEKLVDACYKSTRTSFGSDVFQHPKRPNFTDFLGYEARIACRRIPDWESRSEVEALLALGIDDTHHFWRIVVQSWEYIEEDGFKFETLDQMNAHVKLRLMAYRDWKRSS